MTDIQSSEPLLAMPPTGEAHQGCFARFFWTLVYLIPFVALVMSEKFRDPTLFNAAVQFVIFFFISHIPGCVTGRLSYVDVAWPWGLAAIGGLTLGFGTGTFWRKVTIGVIYLFIGGRMGLGAIRALVTGKLNNEFPRYDYRKLVWKEHEVSSTGFELQVEVFKQAYANMALCVLPALLIGFYESDKIHPVEIVGFVWTVLSYIWEHTADLQKKKFLAKCQAEGVTNQTCNVGLWSVVRHPNYFGEWNVWNGLIIASAPALMALYTQEPKEELWIVIALAFFTLFISYIMYDFLVYQTGAIPAEYYSAQRREGYKEFQKTTPMFFPCGKGDE